MPIDVKCDQCSKRYRLKDELNGKKFKCKECGAIVLAVPLAQPLSDTSAATPSPAGIGRGRTAKKQATRPVADQPQRSRPVKKKKRRKKEPSNPYADDAFGGTFDDLGADDYGEPYPDNPYADDPYDDGSDETFGAAPRRRKKKKKKSGGFSIGFNINRLNIGMVIGGIALIVVGAREMRLASKAGAEPTKVSLADVVQGNTGDNIYLTVTGIASSEEFVYEERSPGRYTRVWIPCRPDGVQNVPSRFILYSTSASDDFAVGRLMNATTHTGMITNDIRSIGSEERKLLESIRGVRAAEALIFEVGRTPSGAGAVTLYFAGGGALCLAGLAWVLQVPDESTTYAPVQSSKRSTGKSGSGKSYRGKKGKPLTFTQLMFSFHGRIRRDTLLAALAGLTVAMFLMFAVTSGIKHAGGNNQAVTAVAALLLLAGVIVFIYCGLALLVKRWHDRGKPGVMVLVGFIPIVGQLWVFIECLCLQGTPGANEYGPEP